MVRCRKLSNRAILTIADKSGTLRLCWDVAAGSTTVVVDEEVLTVVETAGIVSDCTEEVDDELFSVMDEDTESEVRGIINVDWMLTMSTGNEEEFEPEDITVGNSAVVTVVPIIVDSGTTVDDDEEEDIIIGPESGGVILVVLVFSSLSITTVSDCRGVELSTIISPATVVVVVSSVFVVVVVSSNKKAQV